MFLNNLFNNYSPFNNYSNNSYKNQPRTRQEPFYRNDTRSIIINKLLNDDNNYICFDCYKKMNIIKYYDIKNAIFLCYNCTLNHTHLSSEITEVVAGDIRTLDEKFLLLLYYGGNKNLIEFIRLYYPLLERMDKNKMYSTKAMDYYRKLIRAKAFNEPAPNMPRKLEGYNSIFKNKINPANEINFNRRNNRDMMDIDNDDINNSNFGRNMKNKNSVLRGEQPAVNNNKNDEDEDTEMKDDTSKKSDDSTYEDAEGISDKENRIQNGKKSNYFKNENKKEYKINNKNGLQNLTINQLGELSMYPDAKEIEEMD